MPQLRTLALKTVAGIVADPNEPASVRGMGSKLLLDITQNAPTEDDEASLDRERRRLTIQVYRYHHVLLGARLARRFGCSEAVEAQRERFRQAQAALTEYKASNGF